MPELIVLPWILEVFVFAFVIFPVFMESELTFAPTFTFDVTKALPPTPRKRVLIVLLLLILPVLLIFCEVSKLPNSSLPTKRFVI